jgi:hypothetical protein
MKKMILLAALTGCTGGASPAPPSPPAENTAGVFPIERYPLDVAELVGASDLSLAGDGLWAMPERRRAAVKLELTGNIARVTGGMPIDGIESYYDTESLAWLGGDRFAIGTETQSLRRTDDVFLATRRDGKLVVDSRITLDYSTFGTGAGQNHGIEALCWAQPHLVAGSEHVFERDEKRYAPLWRCDPDSGQCERFRLHLTSERGKLSALSCRASGDDIEAMGIERHFSVVRIIRFTIPAGAGRDLEPVVQTDLVPLIGDRINMEGLVWQDDALLMLSDNDTGGVTGPTLLLRMPLLRAARTAKK